MADGSIPESCAFTSCKLVTPWPLASHEIPYLQQQQRGGSENSKSIEKTRQLSTAYMGSTLLGLTGDLEFHGVHRQHNTGLAHYLATKGKHAPVFMGLKHGK